MRRMQAMVLGCLLALCNASHAAGAKLATAPDWAASAVAATQQSAKVAEAAAVRAASSASAATAAASAASAAAVPPWPAPPIWAIYGVPGVVLFGSLLAILSIRQALPSDWSLADALSETVDLPVIEETTVLGAAGAPATVTRSPRYDKDGKPVLAPVLKASSSRVIALMGMLAILFMFVGFGTFILYGYGRTGEVREGTDRVVSFLAAGMTLFAPYLVNKFASLFKGLSGGK